MFNVAATRNGFQSIYEYTPERGTSRGPPPFTETPRIYLDPPDGFALCRYSSGLSQRPEIWELCRALLSCTFVEFARFSPKVSDEVCDKGKRSELLGHAIASFFLT